MTKELFRDDSYLKICKSSVISVDPRGVQLDATVFYPMGGGQPGDVGCLEIADSKLVHIVDTIKERDTGELLHIVDAQSSWPQVGDEVVAKINWERRYSLMRMHSALHVLCSIISGAVTGGQIGERKSRIDFDLPDTNLDKNFIQDELDRIIFANHSVAHRWITDEEMAANSDLVRTMSVKPPMGSGKVRLLEIKDVDLQPCGGTHVAATGEIGKIKIGKIENKGRHNRRINLHLEN